MQASWRTGRAGEIVLGGQRPGCCGWVERGCSQVTGGEAGQLRGGGRGEGRQAGPLGSFSWEVDCGPGSAQRCGVCSQEGAGAETPQLLGGCGHSGERKCGVLDQVCELVRN